MSNKPPCFLLLLISYFLVVFCFLLLALSNPCCSSFFCSSILKTRCKRVFQSLIKILLALLMQLLHYLGKNKTKQNKKESSPTLFTQWMQPAEVFQYLLGKKNNQQPLKQSVEHFFHLVSFIFIKYEKYEKSSLLYLISLLITTYFTRHAFHFKLTIQLLRH